MKKYFCLIAILIASCSLSDSKILIETNSPAVLGDALVENVGIETLGGVFTSILEVGCKLPCESSQIFSTAEDNQNQIMIVVVRGAERLAKKDTRLGKYKINGILPAPRGVPKIKVTFKAVKGSIWIFASDLKGSSRIGLTKLE